jgi:hypothetical protein
MSLEAPWPHLHCCLLQIVAKSKPLATAERGLGKDWPASLESLTVTLNIYCWEGFDRVALGLSPGKHVQSPGLTVKSGLDRIFRGLASGKKNLICPLRLKGQWLLLSL